MRWTFAGIFFATASCAQVCSEIGLQGQSAPACSHEQSGKEQPGDDQCEDCMQGQFLRESKVKMDCPTGTSLEPADGIPALLAPARKLPANELAFFTPLVLRI